MKHIVSDMIRAKSVRDSKYGKTFHFSVRMCGKAHTDRALTYGIVE